MHQDTIIDLEIDGHSVATTEDHPFWNHTDSEWQRADDLDAGDLVLTADGATLTVDRMDWVSARTTTAYNLTVDDIHTYFVEVGSDEVLVHNTCNLASRASDLRARAGRNRVTIETPRGRMTVDLEGRSHFERSLQTSVESPHVKFETRHVGPNAQVSYTSGPVRPATRSVPMTGGGTKFRVTGPMTGPSGQKWTITTAWGVDPDGTVRLITATP